MQTNNIFINQQCGVIYDGYLWGFCADRNELFKTNIRTGILSFVTSFEKLDDRDCLFSYIVSYGGKLILIPGNADYIVTYKIITGEKEYYTYEESFSEYVKYQSHAKYVIIEQYENILYLFSSKQKYILILNMDTMQMEKYTAPFDKLKSLCPVDNELAKSSCRIGDEIYLPCRNSGYILKMNLSNKKNSWIYAGNMGKKGIKYMTCRGKNIFILTQNSEIIEWDYITDESKHICGLRGKYACIVAYQSGILCVPEDKQSFVSIDKDMKVREHIYDEQFKFSPFFSDTTLTHTSVVAEKEQCIVIPRCSNMLIAYDFESEKLEFTQIVPDKDTKSYFYIKFKQMSSNCNIENGIDYTLQSLIRYVVEMDKNSSEVMDECQCGRLVYENI